MRILVVDSYYPAFLFALYERIPALRDRGYSEQWLTLMAQCFGTADFYSRNLQALGHASTEIVANCEQLQRKWASEQGLRLRPSLKRTSVRGLPALTVASEWRKTVMLAQIEAFKPDVVHFQDPASVQGATLSEVHSLCRLVTCQIASPIVPATDFRLFDLVLSSFPHFVEHFRNVDIPSEYFRLGFEPAILERLGDSSRRGTVFVGGFSASHSERISFFEEVAALQDFDWWGYGFDQLSPVSPLRRLYKGEAWGLDMYQRLKNAKIALNHHIDVAGRFANNMRLYEATGVGSMLLTDNKLNLHDLFEPGREVVTYDGATDCAERIVHFLARDDERVDVSVAGQARTMREHTYAARMKEFVGLVERRLS